MHEAEERAQSVGSNPRAGGLPAQVAAPNAQTAARATYEAEPISEDQDTHMPDSPPPNKRGQAMAEFVWRHSNWILRRRIDSKNDPFPLQYLERFLLRLLWLQFLLDVG